jgi:hypothetical protein
LCSCALSTTYINQRVILKLFPHLHDTDSHGLEQEAPVFIHGTVRLLRFARRFLLQRAGNFESLFLAVEFDIYLDNVLRRWRVV